jgi:hypothetical protein
MKILMNDAMAGVIAGMVQSDAPLSHDDLDSAFTRFGLQAGDPGRRDPTGPVGKMRRVKAVLTFATDNRPAAGGDLALFILGRLRGQGAFRSGATYSIPVEMTANLRAELQRQGFRFTSDGEVLPELLDELDGVEATNALRHYARRARAGASDAVLVSGTSKNLLEATARHVLTERVGSYNGHMPFPGTMLHAFKALGIDAVTGGEDALRSQLSTDRIERLYQCLYLAH